MKRKHRLLATHETVDKEAVYEAVEEEVEISKEEVKKTIPEFENLDEIEEFIRTKI